MGPQEATWLSKVAELLGNRFELGHALFSLDRNAWSRAWGWAWGTVQKPGIGQGVPSQSRRPWEPPVSGWAPCAHSCNGRSVLHTHLPNRTGQAGRQAVTPPSLLHTWRLKDPPSPAQGLCRLTPCVNLPSHPDPADGSGGAPSGSQSPWEFIQEFVSPRWSSV